jgi:hypothetical protein
MNMRHWMMLIEASDFARQAGDRLLYRGIDNDGATPLTFDTNQAKNLSNASLHPESFALFNKFLSERFGLSLDTVHHFSGQRKVASYYGNVYCCQPRDGFRFAWSPMIQDHGNAMLEFQIEATKILLGDKAKTMADDAIEDQMWRWTDDEPKGFHDQAMRLFLDRYGASYINHDLAAALVSGNEILLRGVYTAELC